MYTNKLLLIAFTALLLCCSSSCGGLKPGSSGNSGKYFETFYAGSDGGTQYFIKPMNFEGEDKQELIIDFTLRDINFKKDSTTVNYSLATNEQLGPNQSLTVKNSKGKTLFTTVNVERLFQERTKIGFLARFTAKAENVAVAKAFEAGEFTVEVGLESGASLTFIPESRTKNIISDVYRNLFSLY